MKVLRNLERKPDLPGPDFSFFCPACDCYHVVWVKPPGQTLWTFKGTMERPTFEPSLRITGGPEGARTVCHFVVTDGVLHFQPDCTHSLAGKSVPMVDVGP